jgi:hypothetical protein
MTGRPSKVAGIPSPDYILNGEIPADRITKGEYKGTNPTYKTAPQPATPVQPQAETTPADTDPDTAEENKMSKDWLEKTLPPIWNVGTEYSTSTSTKRKDHANGKEASSFKGNRNTHMPTELDELHMDTISTT